MWEKFCHVQISVANHRILHGGTLRFLDVAHPFGVAFDRIDRQPDQFGIALDELWFDLRHIAKFGSAHRSEVVGM